ncbi:nucleoside monophosphate kinase, partial [Candidatus Giovannonibacteria bacterium]|nr:nucleoside monophosphate kinase [Candidatus Giovannonibacteria bacterium]
MENNPYNFVFIGRSGCGKGTQAELLKKLLEEKSGAGSVLYIYTGNHLRELKNHVEFLTARLLDEKILKKGEKAPDSLAVWAYTTELIHGVREDNHVIIDGSPRTVLEAKALDEMFDFYERANVFHIHLKTSAENVSERMLKRGRFDDNSENIKNRMSYYEKYVVPAIEYFEKDSKHKF